MWPVRMVATDAGSGAVFMLAVLLPSRVTLPLPLTSWIC